MPVMRLRPTRAEDLGYVTTLERAPENREHIGQWTDEEHLEAIGRRRGREHWIIERGGKPAGYLIAFDGTARGAGIYVKRILVGEKERGTGTAALTSFLDEACGRRGVYFVWLMVRDRNERAQAVYRKLGFTRHEPAPEVAAHWDATVDPAGEGVFRMRIEASAWRLSRAR
jgi:ribosomal protein S18 acetylase RimI-like enzyme